MNETELDQYINGIEDAHDQHDWSTSLENAFYEGLVDSWGAPIPTDYD